MVYASLEKGITEFRTAETGPKSQTCRLLLITRRNRPEKPNLQTSSDYFHIHKHLMRPYAQFTWSRPIRRPNGVRTTSSSPTVRPVATFQHVLHPMRQQQPDALFRQLDQAWQGASPLQRRLAVATATTPPHPLRRTGAAQHHLSSMWASIAKRLLSVA